MTWVNKLSRVIRLKSRCHLGLQIQSWLRVLTQEHWLAELSLFQLWNRNLFFLLALSMNNSRSSVCKMQGIWSGVSFPRPPPPAMDVVHCEHHRKYDEYLQYLGAVIST